MFKSGYSIVVLVLLTLTISNLRAAEVFDVLELPSVESPLAAKSMMYSVTRQGDRFFAAGHRGHILYSDDFGETWSQASVPVRSAILDIHFPTPNDGWAVGHSGVILHSSDRGETWNKQFDGHRLGAEGLEYYQSKSAAEPDNVQVAFLVEEMVFAVEQGADKPFFKVYFEDETSGYAAGAYGILFRTEDGGKTWFPQMELLDVGQYMHLFDLDRLDGKYVIAGEAGSLLRVASDDVDAGSSGSGLYVLQEYPYEGSIFTVLATGEQQLFAGGLEGSCFYSEDGGVSWSEVSKPKSGSIIDSIMLSDGRVLIVSGQGKLMVSDDQGKSFSDLQTGHRGRTSSILESGPGQLIVTGAFGLRTLKIDADG